MKKIPKLLSPAGSFESLKAAVQNGCDAVYFGGKDFSARNAAENIEDLKEAIDYCHLRGVSCYITVNTLYRKKEFKALLNFIEIAYEAGADAFIVSDLGLISVLTRYFPNIPLHASTQMAAHSLQDILFLNSLGFLHVVAARELSLIDLKYITDNSPCEIETFAHGALCVCYSGRCLMSSFLGGRSGNRGRCAQPCRLAYQLFREGNDKALNSGYLLCPKDLMSLNLLREIADAGVSILKIEGRMRSPQYTALTTGLYRAALDSLQERGKLDITEAENQLLQIFNRGGSFTSGYYKSYSGQDMLSVLTSKATGTKIGQVLRYDRGNCTILTEEALVPGDGIEIWSSPTHVGTGINKAAEAGSIFTLAIAGDIKKGDMVYRSYHKRLFDAATKSYEKDSRKILITGSVQAKLNEALRMTLNINEHPISVTQEGGLVEAAQKTAVTRDDILTRLSKTGDTNFQIEFENSDIDDGIFIPVKDLNNLRRDAVSELADKYLSSFRRKKPIYRLENLKPESAVKKLTVLVSTKEQFDAAVKAAPHLIYVEATCDNLKKELIKYYADTSKEHGVKLFYALPHIDTSVGEKLIYELNHQNIHGFLARTLGQLYLIEETGKEIAADYTMNIFNPYSAAAISNCEIKTLSAELSLVDLADFGAGCEIIIHGRMILMHTRQCPVGNFNRSGSGPFCGLKGHKDLYYLLDRKNVAFPIVCDCENCIAAIYNSALTFTLDKARDFKPLTVEYYRLQFTTEEKDEVFQLVSAYNDIIVKSGSDEKYKPLVKMYGSDRPVTNGHFYRGAF